MERKCLLIRFPQLASTVNILKYSLNLITRIVSKCNFQGVQCQFWDLGGGGDLPKLWKKYYAEAHAVLFVIDSVSIETDRLREALSKTFAFSNKFQYLWI